MIPAATSARSPVPSSRQRRARKNVWKRRSPSSSTSFGRVALADGLGDLVGLLDRVRHDRRRRLLAVPGTVDPQPLRQPLEPDHRVGQEQVAQGVAAGDDLVPVPLGEQPAKALARCGSDRRVGVDGDAVLPEPARQRLAVGHRDGPCRLERVPRRERHEIGIAGAEGDQGGHAREPYVVAGAAVDVGGGA